MKKRKYAFDPIKHGFEPIKNYPELGFNFNVNDDKTFVKIICYDNFGDLVYWYMVLSDSVGFPNQDDRVQIYKGVYDFRKPSEYEKQTKSTVNYTGLISNDQFAESLIKHLLGTTQNNSLQAESIKRYNDNVGVRMRAEFPQHYNKLATQC